MDIPVVALAFVTAVYTVLVLVIYDPLASLWEKYGRRPKVMHKSVQPTQSNFALKEGQTLIGVIDTTKVMCFYIDHERNDKLYD
jgi:hypothetical protein